MLSIIIPADEDSFAAAQSLRLDGAEVIFVAIHEAKTRAERINLGVQRSRGEMILLHHPRSALPAEAVKSLYARRMEKFWGGFTHKFDVAHPLLVFTSFYSNFVRPRLQKVVYLDHCIFFHRSFWRPLPVVAIFEDTLLSKHLKQFGAPVILEHECTTSAVRFTKNGILHQLLLNQLMKLGYYLNVPHERLNALYEKGLNLNAEK